MTLLQFYRFTLALYNVTGFTLKALVAAWTAFDFVFIHIVVKTKVSGFLPSQE